MKIAIGCDHYGFELKQHLMAWLKGEGHEPVDCGGGEEADEKLLDYTDRVCAAVREGEAERGVLICMSGGLPLVRANRWQGIRAVLGWNVEALKHDRQASDVNILTLAGQYMLPVAAEELMETFMFTEFEALERRVARLAKLDGETRA